VKETPRQEWSTKTVRDVVVPCYEKNTIHPKADAVKALSLMKRDGASRLMVTEGDHLVGIIALKDLLEFLSLKMELDKA